VDFDPRFWHKRFTQQAGWTTQVRRYILQTLRVNPKAPILEVGCGTGAVLERIYREGYHRLYGADIAFPGLEYARHRDARRRLVCANGLHLPFRDGRFTISLCHYMLLWAGDPFSILSEMKRVTASGGYLVVLAEPDYSRRQDEPPPLRKLGELQNMALLSMGANLDIGGKIQSFFTQLDLKDAHVSMLKPSSPRYDPREAGLEWQVMAYDLQHLVDQGHLTKEQLEHYRLLDAQARVEGNRILHIPTYFGWAQVP